MYTLSVHDNIMIGSCTHTCAHTLTLTHTHTHTYALSHTHTHAYTHTLTHAHTHAHTHTHTHTRTLTHSEGSGQAAHHQGEEGAACEQREGNTHPPRPSLLCQALLHLPRQRQPLYPVCYYYCCVFLLLLMFCCCFCCFLHAHDLVYKYSIAFILGSLLPAP